MNVRRPNEDIVVWVIVIFVPILSISLFGVVGPERTFWQRIAGLLMFGFFTFVLITLVHTWRSFTHVVLKPDKLTVHWLSGWEDEYDIPESIKKVDFDYGYAWVDFDNGRRSLRLSESMFREQDLFKQWLADNVPVVLCHKDGRVEKASFFDGYPGKDAAMVIGTTETVRVTARQSTQPKPPRSLASGTK